MSRPQLNAPVERQTKHQNITCSPVQSTTKQGSRCGPLVCPSNQAVRVCRRFVPDIQLCGTHGREDLVNATITGNSEVEEEDPSGATRKFGSVQSIDSFHKPSGCVFSSSGLTHYNDPCIEAFRGCCCELLSPFLSPVCHNKDEARMLGKKI